MNLVNIQNNEVVTSSLVVADNFDKSHKHVLESIDSLQRGLAEKSATLFHDTTYIHPQNKQSYRMVVMNKKGFSLLAMGFTGEKALEFKLAFLDEFERMEQQLRSNVPVLSPTEITLRLAQQQVDQEQRIVRIEQAIDEQMTINYGQQQAILNAKNIRVEKLWNAQTWDGTLFDTKNKLHARAWRDLKNAFGVSSYKDIRPKDFYEAMTYVKAWRPALV
ncbi:putative regulatory protein [Exiguobacterium phage vB_EauS-123]|nr:putative regulatory protein [Exiguobacterium phage vB_EauS-123]